MATYLRRGLVAGLIAGLVAGVFGLILGEPLIEKALRYEVVPPGAASAEVFSRSVQRVGLVVATVIQGAGLGAIFGFVYAFVGPRLRSGSAWERPMRLASATFFALWLIPFVKYPMNPPAVGDPGTIGYRTQMFLAMIAVSVVAAIGAWVALRHLAGREVPAHRRHFLVGAGYVAVIGAAYALLPGNPDPIQIPAKLLWNVRLISVATQAVLWTALGAAFAIASRRAEARTALGAVVRGSV